MTQEVQVTITLEVDASKSKEDIKAFILDMEQTYTRTVSDRNRWEFSKFTVTDIKEESEIYGTEEQAPANNDKELRMFHAQSPQYEETSLGVVQGTTPTELNESLKKAIDDAFFVDGDSITIPEIDWNFWEKQHQEEVIVSFISMGKPRNETIELTYISKPK